MAKRTRITRPYPTHSIQDSLPVAETIQRVNGGRPVETELLAEALGTSAKSSTFIQKLNASSKYGLTLGSYSDDFIQLTELGESVTAPGSAEEREDSIVEAVTYPDVFREFYRIYSGKRLPEDIYASNTLVRELGVPRELTEECLGIIRRNGSGRWDSVGSRGSPHRWGRCRERRRRTLHGRAINGARNRPNRQCRNQGGR